MIQFHSIPGLVPYPVAQELQEEWVELRIQDKIPDTVLFLEHEPVITRGRGLQWIGISRPKHVPLLQPLPAGIAFCESQRGGDLTYHGPGQLVIYPVCKLDGQGFAPNRDIAQWIRRIEKVIIDELRDRGVPAGIQSNATGVWVGQQKIASLGIALRKWVSYHGIALNCVNDLRSFQWISPCGFSPNVMTRLLDWVTLGDSWREELEASFIRRICQFDASRSAAVRFEP